MAPDTSPPDSSPCPTCATGVPVGHEVEAWCECGDLAVDHGGGTEEPCAICGCPAFEWDGRVCCPRCLAALDGGQAVAPVLPARRTRAA